MRPPAVFSNNSDGRFAVLRMSSSLQRSDGIVEEDDGAVHATSAMLFYDFFLKKMDISHWF